MGLEHVWSGIHQESDHYRRVACRWPVSYTTELAGGLGALQCRSFLGAVWKLPTHHRLSMASTNYPLAPTDAFAPLLVLQDARPGVRCPRVLAATPADCTPQYSYLRSRPLVAAYTKIDSPEPQTERNCSQALGAKAAIHATGPKYAVTGKDKESKCPISPSIYLSIYL